MTTAANNIGGTGKIWRGLLWSGLTLLLLLPAAAMQVTDEVDWSAADFLVMSLLLGMLGLSLELVARWLHGRWTRVAVGFAILLVFCRDLGGTCGRRVRIALRRQLASRGAHPHSPCRYQSGKPPRPSPISPAR